MYLRFAIPRSGLPIVSLPSMRTDRQVVPSSKVVLYKRCQPFHEVFELAGVIAPLANECLGPRWYWLHRIFIAFPSLRS